MTPAVAYPYVSLVPLAPQDVYDPFDPFSTYQVLGSPINIGCGIPCPCKTDAIGESLSGSRDLVGLTFLHPLSGACQAFSL